MVSLLHLPTEVVLLILSELSVSSQIWQLVSQDLLSCRQTCRQLCESATPLVFKTRHVIIEKTNVDNLIRISECPNLAKHIQALQIHTLHLPTIKNIKRVIPSFTLDSNESETAKGSLISASNKNILGSLDKDTCRKYYEKQQELMTCSDTWSRLHDAFLRLEACKEVAFNSKNPPRDSSLLEQSFGTLLQRSRAKSSASTKFILHLIFGVLNAAANHKSQIKSFEIHIGCAIRDVLYRILTFAFGFLKPITGLSRLHLVVEHDFEQDKLQKFFDLFPGLTDLKLEMDSRESVKISGGALSVLHVPNLQKLTLAMVNCIPVELEDLIIRHQKTLQDITLVCITLPDDRSWRLIFQKIVENLKIKRFSMGKCLQDEDLEPSDITKLIDSTPLLSGSLSVKVEIRGLSLAHTPVHPLSPKK